MDDNIRVSILWLMCYICKSKYPDVDSDNIIKIAGSAINHLSNNIQHWYVANYSILPNHETVTQEMKNQLYNGFIEESMKFGFVDTSGFDHLKYII